MLKNNKRMQKMIKILPKDKETDYFLFHLEIKMLLNKNSDNYVKDASHLFAKCENLTKSYNLASREILSICSQFTKTSKYRVTKMFNEWQYFEEVNDNYMLEKVGDKIG